MTRVKSGIISHKKRENLLKYAKGFKWGRKNKGRAAKEALLHAWTHAFQGRKEKKRTFRALWNVKINAAVRLIDDAVTYSKLINLLHKKNILIDRKVLADLAENHPDVFKKVVESVK